MTTLYSEYTQQPSGVTILYGSETGNAEGFARYLYLRLRYLNLAPVLLSLDEYPLKKLVTDTRYLIIICSTLGQGDLPRNATKFMKFLLKKKLPEDLFNHIRLTTLGLGDSSYTKFNYAIRKIHARLMQLGCVELSPRAEADEMSPEGLDGFYKAWEEALMSELIKYFPDRAAIDEAYVLPPDHKVIVADGEPDIVTDTLKTYQSRAVNGDQSEPSLGKLVKNTRVTASDHFQDIRHIVVDTDININFSPGDCAALYPVNDDASVELLIQLQPHWIPFADKPLVIDRSNPYTLVDIPEGLVTLRGLLTQYLDITAIPRRSFFNMLWHFVDTSSEDGQREQEKMREFAGLEDVEELYNYANRPRRLILETVLEFQANLTIPIERVLDLFPRIRPRLFSIASKPDSHRFELVVGIVEYKTMLRRIRRGLCTKWLKLLEEGSPVLFSIVKANIRYDKSRPLIMVAPGTGIAPMKAVVEDWESQNISTQSPQNGLSNMMYLFYGCRHEAKDFLFTDVWANQPQLLLLPCFSRDGGSVRYVQDKLYEQRDLVGELLVNKNAGVFVCGLSGAMPKQVKITLVDIVSKKLGLSEEQATEWVVGLEDAGRYVEDTW